MMELARLFLHSLLNVLVVFGPVARNEQLQSLNTNCSSHSPETYIFSFPELMADIRYIYKGGESYRKLQLTISTSHTHNVTVTVSQSKYYFQYQVKYQIQTFVVSQSTSPLLVPLEHYSSSDWWLYDGVTSSPTVAVSTSDSVTVQAYSEHTDIYSPSLFYASGQQMSAVTELGTDYVVVMLPDTLSSTDTHGSFVLATATSDNTRVRLHLPSDLDYSLVTTAAYQTYDLDDHIVVQVTLEAEQTALVKASHNLTKVEVHADQPVSVVSGVQRTGSLGHCCWAHPWVQLPSLDRWGVHFIALPTDSVTTPASATTTSPDHLNNVDIIVASEDVTTPTSATTTSPDHLNNVDIIVASEDVTTPTSTTTASPDRLNNVYTIVASEDDTEVTINQTALTLLLTSAMDWRTEELDARYTHLIKGNKPVLVLRSTPASNGTQPSIVVLTNTSTMVTTLTLAVPDTSSWQGGEYEFSAIFVTEEPSERVVTVNGRQYTVEWNMMSWPHCAGCQESVLYAVGQMSGLSDGLLNLSSVHGTASWTAYVTAYSAQSTVSSTFAWRGQSSQGGCQQNLDAVSGVVEIRDMSPSSGPSGVCVEKTPEKYVFSFPEMIPFEYRVNDTKDSSISENQLIVLTSRPHKVSVQVTYSTYISAEETILLEQSHVLFDPDNTFTLVLESDGKNYPKTVMVTSDDDVDVYVSGMIREPGGSFTLISQTALTPINDLDTQFVVTLRPSILGSEWVLQPFFVVTAVDDVTTVNISVMESIDMDLSTFSIVDTVSSKDGQREISTVVLQAREPVKATTPRDMVGVVIMSDKPVSVTAGFRTMSPVTDVCCWGHPWLQLPPVSAWGDSYATFPFVSVEGNSSIRAMYYMVSSQHNTTVYYESVGHTLAQTFGWSNMSWQDTNFGHVLSGQPFQVMVIVGQQTGQQGLGQPCMLALSASDLWLTTLTFPMPETSPWTNDTFRYRLVVISEEANRDDITLDGALIDITWNTISEYWWMSPLVGGELDDVTSGVHVLSSVSGTSRMAAYVMGGTSSSLLVCFQVSGTDEAQKWESSFDHDCQESTTAVHATEATSTVKQTAKAPTISSALDTVTIASPDQTAVSAHSTATTADRGPVVPAQCIQRCHCLHQPRQTHNTSHSQLDAAKEAMVESIKSQLTVPTGNISSKVRQKTSVSDQRSTSVTIGYLAVFTISVVLALPVMVDSVRLATWLRSHLAM